MTNKKDLSERDICTKFISPALEQAGRLPFIPCRSDWHRHAGDYFGTDIPCGKDMRSLGEHAAEKKRPAGRDNDCLSAGYTGPMRRAW